MTEFIVHPGPYVRKKRTTRQIMIEVFLVLSTLWISSIIYHFVKFDNYQEGLMTIVIGIVAIFSSCFFEGLYFLPSLLKKHRLEFHFGVFIKELLMKIFNSYGYVSGLILTLLLPVGTPIYVVIVGSFVGVFICKMLFGGFGSNIFNPAIVGRVFVQLCFPLHLKTYVNVPLPGIDGSTGSSITAIVKKYGWFVDSSKYGYSFNDLFFGNYSGTIGETFAFLIIIIGIYFIVRKIIDWKLPVVFLSTFYLTSLITAFSLGHGSDSFLLALNQLLMGGVLFGAFICLTDPVTSPTSNYGRVIYALIAVFFSMLIRYLTSASEGVAYSILLANMLTPLLEKYNVSRANKQIIKKVIFASILSVAIVATISISSYMRLQKADESSVITHEIVGGRNL